MGCSLKKEKSISTTLINEQNTFYFVIINGDQGLKNFKNKHRFSNSVPTLSSINHSTIISRRKNLFQSQYAKIGVKIDNFNSQTREQHQC